MRSQHPACMRAHGSGSDIFRLGAAWSGLCAVIDLVSAAGVMIAAPSSLDELLEAEMGAAGATAEGQVSDDAKDDHDLMYGPATTVHAPGDLEPLVWRHDTCCYEPHMYRAEAGVARLLTDLAVQQPAKHVSSSKYAASVQKWIDKSEQNSAVPPLLLPQLQSARACSVLSTSLCLLSVAQKPL